MSADGDVAAHYGRGSLAARIGAALDAAGLGDARLTARDLAPIDQFHTGGLRATADLAAALHPTAGASVLDIGSGLGGAARYLAATFGSHVEGIDLSPSFVEAARLLTERCGLTDVVHFDVGDALALPYADRTFDIVWTQHAAMNIRNRVELYAEVFRVLTPGGRFGISDVLAGTGAVHFPVPWAADEHTSFLMDAGALRAVLEAAGFHVVSWIDRTATSVASLGTPGQAPRSPLNLALVMGPDFPRMVANLARNLREGRVTVAEVVVEKP
jgi:ubiquinone/menaquinone biosynthesis C-methylase UbiE